MQVSYLSEMDVPVELGLEMLRYASTPSEYIAIQNRMNISDEDIRDAIYNEAISGLEHLSPIEQLYGIHHKCDRYMILYTYHDNVHNKLRIENIDPMDIAEIGSKNKIISSLASKDIDYLISAYPNELSVSGEELYKIMYKHYKNSWKAIKAAELSKDRLIALSYGINNYTSMMEDNIAEGRSPFDLSRGSDGKIVIVKLP